MNKTVVFALIGLMVGGCASIDSVEETNQKIAELEKRVTELEKTRGGGSPVLSRRGRPLVKSAENAVLSEAEKAQREAEREQQRKKLLAFQEEQKRIREAREAAMAAEMAASKKEDHVEVGKKVNGFLKEHFGVQFGDSGASFTNVLSRQDGVNAPQIRALPILKKRWYFTGATGYFCDDKLYQVDIHANIDAKYSKASCDEQFEKTLADFENDFRMPNDSVVSYDLFRRYNRFNDRNNNNLRSLSLRSLRGEKTRRELAQAFLKNGRYLFAHDVAELKSESGRCHSYTFAIIDGKQTMDYVGEINKQQDEQRRLDDEKHRAEEDTKRAKGEPLPEVK